MQLFRFVESGIHKVIHYGIIFFLFVGESVLINALKHIFGCVPHTLFCVKVGDAIYKHY